MLSPGSAGHLAMLVHLGCALAGCSATVDQSTLLPAHDEPAAVSAVMPGGLSALLGHGHTVGLRIPG